MFSKFFKPRVAVQAGKALYAAAVTQSRQPVFYRLLGITDDMGGRFELLALHVMLILERLKGRGEAASETGQALFDTFIRALDDVLREQGVGDLAVARQMKKLGQHVYGRIQAYETAFSAEEPGQALADTLVRIVYAEQTPDDGHLEGLIRYIQDSRSALAAQPLEGLVSGQVTWPPILLADSSQKDPA
ncbi:MAG: ubiquinol-cytochrome C chaperone family protein [Asticcacaulis sp.]